MSLCYGADINASLASWYNIMIVPSACSQGVEKANRDAVVLVILARILNTEKSRRAG